MDRIMARNDFQLAAELAEASCSSDGWMSIGQSARAAAIYRELRAIDAKTAERRRETVQTARRCVHEAEERVARQEWLLEGVETAQGSESARGRKSLDVIRNSLDLAKYRLRELEAVLPPLHS
jgi:hypothetical protein